MKLLLDTHVVLWWSQGGGPLKPQTRRRIDEADEVFVSAASAWEVGIKAALGRLSVPGPLLDVVAASGFSPLPIDFAHAAAAGALPPIHADPFDRMLVAQAMVEGLHLCSHDRALARYPVLFLAA